MFLIIVLGYFFGDVYLFVCLFERVQVRFQFSEQLGKFQEGGRMRTFVFIVRAGVVQFVFVLCLRFYRYFQFLGFFWLVIFMVGDFFFKRSLVREWGLEMWINIVFLKSVVLGVLGFRRRIESNVSSRYLEDFYL